MPIDFAAIADAYRPLIQQQLKTASTVFARLGTWLKPLVSAAERAERATRDVPILLTRGGAIAATIHTSQWGALATSGPPATFGSTVRGAWERFTRGLALIPHLVREELVLPRAGAAVLDAVDAIVGSVERFLPLVRRGDPSAPRFFDLDRPGRPGDVFGAAAVLGLTGRSVYQMSGALMDDLDALSSQAGSVDWASLGDPITTGVGDLVGLFSSSDASGSSAGGGASGTAAAGEGGGLTMTGIAAGLQSVAQGILGAVMILPMLPGLLGPMLQAGLLRARILVLDVVQSIERSLFSVRRSIINVFAVSLPRFGTRAYDLLVVAGVVVSGHLEYAVDFAVAYLRMVQDRFVPYLRRLSRFVAIVTGVVGAITGVWGAIMDFDLVEFLVTQTGIPEAVWRSVPGRPTLTVGELVEGLMAGTATVLLGAVATWLAAVDLAFRASPAGGIDRLAGSPVGTRLRAARNAVAITAARLPGSHLRRPRATPAPGVLPSFPNLAQTVTGSSLDLALLEARLTGLGLRARLSTLRTVHAGALALDRTAVALDEAAAAVTRAGGSRARLDRIARWADALGTELYDDQIQDLRPRTQADTFGRGFVAFMARRGFELLEAAVPLYVDAMSGYWRGRVLGRAEGRFAPPSGLPPYEPPTSPHILDRRARLGRVRVPRLTVRAADRPVTSDLAVAVASHVRREVEQAYATGLDRLDD